jgi:hypothetical protein
MVLTSFSWGFGAPVNYEKFLMGIVITLNLELLRQNKTSSGGF